MRDRAPAMRGAMANEGHDQGRTADGGIWAAATAAVWRHLCAAATAVC